MAAIMAATKIDPNIGLYWEKIGVVGLKCGKLDCKSDDGRGKGNCGVAGCVGSSGNPHASRAFIKDLDGWVFLSVSGGTCFIPDPKGKWLGSYAPPPARKLVPAAQIPVEEVALAPQVAQVPTPPPQRLPEQRLPSQQSVNPQTSDADRLPDIDPNIVAKDFSPVGQAGAETGIVENSNDSFFNETEVMTKLKAQVATNVGGGIPQRQDKAGILVNKEDLETLQMTIAEMGEWIMENYEHHKNKPRVLYKSITLALAKVMPEII